MIPDILSGSGAASISAAIVLVLIGLAAWGLVDLVWSSSTNRIPRD